MSPISLRITLPSLIIGLILLSACAPPATLPSNLTEPAPTVPPATHPPTPLPPSLTPKLTSPPPTKEVTQTHAPGPTLDILSTLIAKGPSIEATFREAGCSLSGPAELPVGEHVILLYNDSGESAYLYPARHYPGKTWAEVLQDIGTPGSESAQAKDIELLPWEYFESANERVSYRQYQFKYAGEYSIVVEGQGKYHGIWPCGAFQVVAAP